jgi:GNAT superfamily N-acetyltransferase
MSTIDPADLEISYSLEYRGVPHPDHDPEDYPLCWRVTATVDGAGPDEDPKMRHAADAIAYLIPDAGEIDLLDTMDAVSQELMGMAEHLHHHRPDLLVQLGGERTDLLYLSSLEVDKDLRGRKIGYAVFNAIMETVARSAELAILSASPILDDSTPAEGTPAHQAEVAALRRYWEGIGFYDIGGGYMAFGGIEGAIRGLGDEGYLDVAEFERFE